MATTSGGHIPAELQESPNATAEPIQPSAAAAANAASATAHVAAPATNPTGVSARTSASPSAVAAAPPRRTRRPWVLACGAVALVAAAAYFLAPWIKTTLNTDSTD